MKNLSIILLVLFFSATLFAQDVGEMKSDTTKIKIGNSTVLIIGPDTKDYEIVAEHDEDEKFRGHWAGLDLGLNSYLNSSNTTSLNLADRYLELNTGKSWGIGVNLIESNIGLVKDNFGIVTGLGLEFNNYRFQNDYTIMSDSTTLYAVESPIEFEKSKIIASYLTLPIIVEWQIPVGQKDKKIHFAVGGIGGLKIGSHSKYVYESNGSRHKDKVHENFHLSPFKYGATVRVGFMGINLFANYSFSTLFENNEGPELYPFTVGLSIGGY